MELLHSGGYLKGLIIRLRYDELDTYVWIGVTSYVENDENHTTYISFILLLYVWKLDSAHV